MSYGGTSAEPVEENVPENLIATLGGKGLSTAARGWEAEDLTDATVAELAKFGHECRGHILRMTEVANSGHPGGSCSSVDFYLVLYGFADIDPARPRHAERDRINISHGHTTPGAYSALASMGFFDIDEVIATFRKTGSLFEGHVDRAVPGIEWSAGNLGQGLSAGCGFALASRLTGRRYNVFTCMSDGEQDKGQVSEARRFAAKYGLTNLTVIMDVNGLQMSGPTAEVMPVDIAAEFEADGWKVLEIDGHDYRQIYRGIREALLETEAPVAVLAHTVMGKGVPQIEGDFHYHGKPLSPEMYAEAMASLGLPDILTKYRALRAQFKPPSEPFRPHNEPSPKIEAGAPRTYEVGEMVDCRSAWGNALTDIAKLNRSEATPIGVLDCDVMDSTKVEGFAEAVPENFFQAGIDEHNTAVIGGALSTQGVLAFWSDFTIYGVDEPYNQQRLNGVMGTNLKTVCTHAGIDVGEDGKTHHSIDYLALANNVFGWKAIVPADANQTDRAIRYIANEPGNFLVAMGRSKVPVIEAEGGGPLFGDAYGFVYGRADVVRDGDEATIVTYGSMVHRAVEAWEKLKAKGHRVRILNVSCPKDLSEDDVAWAAETGLVVTYEDHHVDTGLGAITALRLVELRKPVKFTRLGVWRYADSGSSEEVFAAQGLDADSLVRVLEAQISGRESLDM